ncbi:MFS transporter [Nonomuraea sp. NPDC050547]|uniref:MFS transporter n=1 Tax=Nonomuraea sp. NPDC050547 TaxID=3364368 RepID=UPI0037AF3D86
MANPYAALFRTPGAVAFSLAGFVGRMPISMTGIGVLTMLSQMRGGYALAGAVAATFTLSTALAGPQVSRLVDRLGQGRVLLPAAGLSVAGLAALLLCARSGAPAWTLFVFAALAGTLPNLAAMVRARWTHAHRDSPHLHAAFSLESVVDELTFVIGPALSVALSTAWFPEAGPLVAGVLLVAGVVLLVPQRRTEPPVQRYDAAAGPSRSAVRIPAVRLLALLLAAGGVIAGTVDVVSVAFAAQAGAPASAGFVLAAYAGGSALSGLVFGALRLAVPLPRLLLVSVTGTALTTVPLLFAGGVAALAAAVFAAGLFFAPTMIVVMRLVERAVPASSLTEGMTWAITGLSAGIALGAALAGALVDRYGPTSGFGVAVAAGAVALALAVRAARAPAGKEAKGERAAH